MSTAHRDPSPSTTTTSAPLERFLAGGAASVRGTERRAALRSGLLGATQIPADVVVRPATDADRTALGHLASLDGGRVPGAPLLVAERAEVVVAAIGVLDRRVVADPSSDASAAIDRLQAAAAERRGPERRRRWAARLRRRTTTVRGAVTTAGRSDAPTA